MINTIPIILGTRQSRVRLWLPTLQEERFGDFIMVGLINFEIKYIQNYNWKEVLLFLNGNKELVKTSWAYSRSGITLWV